MMVGPVQTAIREKLSQAFSPSHLEVENESHTHSVPAGSETHFRVLIVSARFEGLSRVARQRLVNDLLKEEFAAGLHALTQRTLTPAEFSQGAGDGFISPACLGGSKRS